jgi:hypothetical protein
VRTIFKKGLTNLILYDIIISESEGNTMIKNLLKYYTEQKEMYTKLYQCAERNYIKHYELRESVEDFRAWCDMENSLQSKRDNYDMILMEIDDILIALNDIVESEKNIGIFQKRLDKSNKL